MDIGGLLKTALTSYEKGKERNNQTELGPSNIYTCHAQAWHIINQSPKCNQNTEHLSATMGTAIHAVIAEGLKSINHFDDYMIEFELSTPDIKGHIDFYSRGDKMLIDWKTITLKKVAGNKWLDAQKRTQVQIYGYLLEENGYPIETVALAALPRDAWQFSQLVYHTEPYDREIALKGIEWVRQIKNAPNPIPEQDQFFCRNFCEYFGDVCMGK